MGFRLQKTRNMFNQSHNRRSFLKLTTTGILVGLLCPNPSHAKQQPKYSIVYFWSTNIDAVLDYAEEVGKMLGIGVRKKLQIVKNRKGMFGVIYKRNGSKQSTITTAKKHAKILAKVNLQTATAIAENQFVELYNICYATSSDKKTLKKKFSIVTRMLGMGVKKNLVIERLDEKKYALVYKRFGDLKSTKSVAKKHTGLLKKVKLTASPLIERNNEQVYGESSHLDEIVEKQTKSRKVTTPKPKAGTSEIEMQIEKYIKKLRKKGTIASNEKTAWSVYDFTTAEKLVSINEDMPLQSASMVKPLIALAFFHEVKNKRFVYGTKSKSKMKSMIQKSSNSATNWFISQLGGPKKVNALLKKHYGGILKQTKIVEKIPTGGKTYKNKSSARDYSRFLYALWSNKLPYARELRRVMALPGRDRIYTGVKKIPDGTLVYNKTGSTSRLIGDMGILVAKGKNGKRYAYTVIAIIDKSKRAKNFSSFANKRSKVIRHVSYLTYVEMKKRHKLV